MPEEQVRLLRGWQDAGYKQQKASLPMDMSFMGFRLHIGADVFAPDTDDADGDPYHRAVEAEVRPGDRVLDMGTGSGISALLAARKGAAEVLAVDLNPAAVECAQGNAERNGVGDRITFTVSDVFDSVGGRFDLIIFDPPFRWFKPRDMLEVGSTDESYRALTGFVTHVEEHLESGGRVLLNFGTAADLDYLYELIDQAQLTKTVHPYGELSKDGYTAHHYVIRLTVPRVG